MSRTLKPALLVALALLVPVGPRARADEDFVQGREAPPTLPSGRDAFLEPVEQPDLIGWIGVLGEQIRRFETPPPSTPNVTALRDAWTSILKPRIGRMTRRIDRWQQPGRWVVPAGETGAAYLDPDQWSGFTRDMAMLATELHGAWKQYGSVEIRPKLRQQGYAPPPPSPPSWYLGYPWPTLYQGVLDRQAAASSLGSWTAPTYWHLLDRFRYAWDWSWYRRQAYYAWWQQRAEATDQLFERLYAELDATRNSLAETVLGLQVFMAALQNAEEERLKSHCQACRSDDETLRAMAEAALQAMAQVRQEGERYRGGSSAEYGSILRRWLKLQKAAGGVLDLAHEPIVDPPDED